MKKNMLPEINKIILYSSDKPRDLRENIIDRFCPDLFNISLNKLFNFPRLFVKSLKLNLRKHEILGLYKRLLKFENKKFSNKKSPIVYQFILKCLKIAGKININIEDFDFVDINDLDQVAKVLYNHGLDKLENDGVFPEEINDKINSLQNNDKDILDIRLNKITFSNLEEALDRYIIPLSKENNRKVVNVYLQQITDSLKLRGLVTLAPGLFLSADSINNYFLQVYNEYSASIFRYKSSSLDILKENIPKRDLEKKILVLEELVVILSKRKDSKISQYCEWILSNYHEIYDNIEQKESDLETKIETRQVGQITYVKVPEKVDLSKEFDNIYSMLYSLNIKGENIAQYLYTENGIKFIDTDKVISANQSTEVKKKEYNISIENNKSFSMEEAKNMISKVSQIIGKKKIPNAELILNNLNIFFVDYLEKGYLGLYTAVNTIEVQGDRIQLKIDENRDYMLFLLIHELGHRYHFCLMNDKKKVELLKLFKILKYGYRQPWVGKKVPISVTMPYFAGSIDKNYNVEYEEILNVYEEDVVKKVKLKNGKEYAWWELEELRKSQKFEFPSEYGSKNYFEFFAELWTGYILDRLDDTQKRFFEEIMINDKEAKDLKIANKKENYTKTKEYMSFFELEDILSNLNFKYKCLVINPKETIIVEPNNIESFHKIYNIYLNVKYLYEIDGLNIILIRK